MTEKSTHHGQTQKRTPSRKRKKSTFQELKDLKAEGVNTPMAATRRLELMDADGFKGPHEIEVTQRTDIIEEDIMLVVGTDVELKTVQHAVDSLFKAKRKFTGKGSYLVGTLKKSNKETSESAARTAANNLDENDVADLTQRGTPRVRRPKRSSDDVAGDPRADANRYDAKIGARVDRNLRDRFVSCSEAQGMKQGDALTEALEDFLNKYNCEGP